VKPESPVFSWWRIKGAGEGRDAARKGNSKGASVTYYPSYSGGRDEEVHGLKPVWKN
jgi:hypothetical protein